MNIPFSTILIFILLLPGAVFSRFYYSGEFSKQYFKPTAYELFVATLVPSLLLHLLGLLVMRYGWQYTLDWQRFGLLLAGGNNRAEVFEAFGVLNDYGDRILAYNLSLWGFAFVAGLGSKLVVRKLKLDRKYPLFRFQNEWYYVVTGEILDFPRMPGKAEDKDFILVDAAVNSPEGTIIYTGILNDYRLSKTGGLELLYMSKVTRRFLQGRRQPFELKGILVLPYSTVLNLHFSYYEISLGDTEIDKMVAQAEQPLTTESNPKTSAAADTP